MAENKERIYNVAVVDNHPVVWHGLTLILEPLKNIRMLVQARDGTELFLNPELKQCDLVIAEIALPRTDGMGLVDLLRKNHPRAAVLVFTSLDGLDHFSQCMGLGVRGYVIKRDPPETLLNAVRNILAGRMGISPTISPMLLETSSPDPRNRALFEHLDSVFRRLTDREREVLGLVAGGLTSKQIAASLNLKVNTVNKHRENIRVKLGKHKVTELIFYARSEGLV